MAQSGVGVYVFSGAGVYQNVNGTTNAVGQVSFLMAEGQQWKFRADRSGRQFWSEKITAPGTATAVIPMPTTITVTQGGVAQNATPVYAFTAAGTYLTYSVSTAANGEASFLLPEGSDYKLRADKNGRQFWSPVFTAPATTSVDIPLPSTVSITQGGVVQANTPVYVFDGAGTYLSLSGTTNALGQVSFELATGGQFRFRADRGGYQFWSEVFTAPATASVTIPQPSTVTVVQGDIPQPGTVVYLFSAGGVYQNRSALTDANGQCVFLAGEGQDWMFRADQAGQQFWSAVVTAPGAVTVTIPRPTTVTVMQGGVVQAGLPVYAFQGSTYLNLSRTADANGQASFLLTEGTEFRIRADKAGQQFWSEAFTAPGTPTVTIPMPTSVTVTQGGVVQAGLPVYAFQGSTYLGLSKLTDTNGQASFLLTEGTDFRIRADKAGQQFWSEVFTASAAVPIAIPQVTTVTVTRNGQPLMGQTVYAFTSGGTYFSLAHVSDAAGQVTFLLTEGSEFKFRSDLLGFQFWSGVVTAPGATSIAFPADTVVTVTLNGQPRVAQTVYAFAANDGYLGLARVTDASGEARLVLAAGQQVKFRADIEGVQYFSAAITTPGAASVAVVTETPPQITVQVLPQTVGEGATATFMVTATGGNLQYQWQRNGEDIPGATQPSYTTPVLTIADNGTSYRCRVSNTQGEVFSDPAIVTVLDVTPPTPPNKPVATVLSSSSVQLTWGASTDNVGVTGYRVYRDGEYAGETVDAPFTDIGLRAYP